MEDLFGFLLFLLIAVISSIGSRQPRERQARRRSHPAWPPVAPYPDPLDPSLPPEAPAAPRQDRTRKPEPAAAKTARQETAVQRDEEGVQTEGPQEKRPGEAVLAERQEFARHRAEFTAAALTPGLQSSIHPASRAAVQVAARTAEPATADSGSGLKALLQDRDSLAQAFLLAEVLGKPKALRFRR